MSRARKLALAVTCTALPLLTPAGASAGGSLTLTAPATASFSATLNGSNLTPTYTLALTIADTRTGKNSAGWNLTIDSTAFSSGSNTLAPGSVTSVTSTCQSSCSVNPTNSVASPQAVATSPATVMIYNAAADTGRGTFTITPTVQVPVPANAAAGSYTATVTTAVVSGP